MIKSINRDEIIFAILLSVLPVLLVVILSMFVMLTSAGKNEVIQTAIVLISSFVIVPYILIKKNYGMDLRELGVSFENKFEILVELFVILIFAVCIKYIVNPPTYLSLVGSTLFVAVCEEFWARGCLFYIFGRIFNNKVIVLLISTFIFVFVVHVNRGIVENALYRLPGALIMGLIYWRTGKLQYSIGFHFIYNILGSI